MNLKRYSELIQLPTFEERLAYLKLNGTIGFDTFGFDRYLNQEFYRSKEWKDIRRKVIVRDNCCDLGVEGYDITKKVYIHHMNPITVKDISEASRYLLDPEFLITVSFATHNYIHYGVSSGEPKTVVERKAGDTCPWK